MSASKLSSLSLPSMSLISTTVLNKSLSTMVKGIRDHKDKGEAEYIAACVSEIKAELSTPYADVKAQALQKLIYLQMIGQDIAWASFNIVEVMSAPWFGHKRIGYLAASLCFTPQTDVILLTTHLFRKGFTQPSSTGSSASEGLQYETGAAIACLSNIATADLSMDLLNDVYALMNSSRPYIRKKAVLVLLRLFRQWPKALRLSFERLKEKLNDEHQGVVSAAVYVICELAARNPKNYLSLAPQLFKILTTSSNNWVLIKVVKLLGSLSPLEPRLAKKLQEPLTDIITTTPAKSLLYECINTLLAGEIKSRSVIRLCLDKLRSFIEDPDQNLKYLGLLGLHRLMKKHPRAVAEHKDLILQCLSDEDVTIRMRALDLITSMVSQRNVVGIVRKMQEHLQQSEGVYREHVLSRILSIGAQDNYSYISDFEWYISVLVDLTHLTGASVSNALSITHQLTDVSIRVPAVRRYAVKAMSDVLLAGRLLSVGGGSNCMSEVLHAAAFIVGEYSEYVEEHLEVLRVMVRREVSSLSGDTQVVFVQAVMKVLASGLYQPFDVSGEDQDVSLDVKVKDLLGRREVEDEDEKEDDGDEVREETEREAQRARVAAEKAKAAEDVDPEQEEEELDANGVKKRKVKARKRSYLDYCTFVGEMLECLYRHLPVFTRSPFVEVQERATVFHELVGWLVEHAHLQPFISTRVERRTRRAEGKDNPTPAKAKDASSAVTDLLDDSSNASSPRQLNGSLPPSSLLSSLAVQVSVLFSERLNPVNPKAQRKVPLPKGLDLDAVINPNWDVDSDRSEEELSESEEEGEEGGRRRKKKDRRREKDRKKKDRKERAVNVYGEEEEDYAKPLTEQEKAEAKRRLDARRAAQMADPFYVKDKPASTTSSLLASSSSSSAADAGLQRLSKDDLPPLHMETERERKKKKKSSRRRGGWPSDDDGGSDDDDDIFAGVGSAHGKGKAKVFTVKKTDDMPSGAENSEEGEGGQDDLASPLRDDEVIPKMQPYGSERREGKDKKKKKKKDRREDDDQRQERRKKKDRERHNDKDRGKAKDGAKEKDREEEGERKKATTSRAVESEEAGSLDAFDPMAAPSRAEKEGKEDEKEEQEGEEEREERRKKKKKDRVKAIARDKERDKDGGDRDQLKGRDKERTSASKSERDSERDRRKEQRQKG